MSWTALLENPEGIDSVFQGSPPPLEGVHIHEVGLNREGPTLRVRFDLSDYPAQAPRKWQLQGFNTVQVELLFGGLRSVEISGFSVEPVGDITLTRDETVHVVISSNETSIRAVADTVSITKTAAYLDDR
ncbi:Imm50 family immunity protein [Streptomyces sp. ActVer]|uniref:Imm50 family immunity protein n=1 Tax=Streptomyces sp. ActVer TaxID=3014558 RepID=UPI0022B4DD27|nr:Imm50 family immunity protein [Streptomyces sp. ActVer]MCZ4515936.1 Imm50 family immunity protein [Streptomyces sp. ActVer]